MPGAPQGQIFEVTVLERSELPASGDLTKEKEVRVCRICLFADLTGSLHGVLIPPCLDRAPLNVDSRIAHRSPLWVYVVLP